jgi:hypothetical protein
MQSAMGVPLHVIVFLVQDEKVKRIIKAENIVFISGSVLRFKIFYSFYLRLIDIK